MDKRGRHARKAAEALTNLNIYAAIVAILEGSVLYGNCNEIEKPKQRMIKICEQEQQKWLRKYDAAMSIAGDNLHD